MKPINILVFLVIGVLSTNSVDAQLKEKFTWKQLSFNWPTPNAEQEAISEGVYIPENNLPLGLERWKNKLFVTVPRWKAGIASSLNYIDLNSSEKSPKLTPYPNWEINTLPSESDTDSSRIISTFRVQVDACDRLWVMDTGMNDVLGAADQVAPNTLFIFDLKTDTLIHSYQLPQDQVKPASFFVNIVVDTELGQCDDAYAYLPDFQAYGLVVYSLSEDKSYRIEHQYFHNDPLFGDFNVGGVNFQWTDGIFGLALGPKLEDDSRDVYFHAMASSDEFKVNSYVLQNESLVTGPNAYSVFEVVGSRGQYGQSTIEAYDNLTNVIFYAELNKNAVSCWNINTPYTLENLGLVEANNVTLVYLNDLKIDPEHNLWVLSDHMAEYMFTELNPNNTNFRILTGKTEELIKGTPCTGLKKPAQTKPSKPPTQKVPPKKVQKPKKKVQKSKVKNLKINQLPKNRNRRSVRARGNRN